MNITIEPPSLDNEVNSDSASLRLLTTKVVGQNDDDENEDEDGENRLYKTNSNISDESSESYDNDTHIASWIEGSLIGSSLFNKEDEEDNKEDLSSDSS